MSMSIILQRGKLRFREVERFAWDRVRQAVPPGRPADLKLMLFLFPLLGTHMHTCACIYQKSLLMHIHTPAQLVFGGLLAMQERQPNARDLEVAEGLGVECMIGATPLHVFASTVMKGKHWAGLQRGMPSLCD